MSRLALYEPPVWYGISEERMAQTYNCFDVSVSTAVGEGMGLTALEAMACGIPCVLPDHSAFSDWATGAAWMIPCTYDVIGFGGPNVIGRVIDEGQFINALQALYQYQSYRDTNSAAALERALQHRFRWGTIGKQYVDLLSGVVAAREEVPCGVSSK